MKKRALLELKRLNPEEFARLPKVPIFFFADQIRSGHNIGSLFRIADAFKIGGVYLSNYCVTPPHPEIEKTAIGSSQTVYWEQVENTLDFLIQQKNKGFQLIGVEQTDQSIQLHEFDINSSQSYILVLGNEVNGIQQELLDILDYCIEIPQFGTKHSLNVSVAAGIVAWHFAKEWF
ncbi:MAG: TrmH family RNA methyltransferase [Saprospiraceae bacterium]|nr:TrmH family RNA methyltransferase [Saprospiraceae bacterium]MBK8484187.1 TrmH family RNA methyltransferase [Saprospiraceae bacterium]MBK9728538.1 TrmH family RNA methyltransferase [Saprospiraceae bacterium]